jgi:hypothetical protein
MYFKQKLIKNIGRFTAYEFQTASKITENYIKQTGVVLKESEVLDLIGSYIRIGRLQKRGFNA